ncbi:MAG: protein-glutamate O-methyltransferase CheR, partial [Thermodesulfobacteriota bacterium]|nr:protein-glutamate O-methyltransferase CheR [Thermodesulfobacteriota bacterium]
MIKVKPEEIKGVADFVYRASGIVLDAKKAYLIESRIGPLVEEAKLLSYAELMRSAGMSRILKRKILDAITTNETLFFRDNSPFEMLQHKVVPDIIDRRESKAGPTKIRIWS